jgi:integrase
MMRYTYVSAFAPYIAGLIQQKQADGYKYASEEWHLKKLDEFCVSRFPALDVITRELAAEWSVIRPTEGKNFRRRRVVILRQLCIYMLSLGLEAYLPRSVRSADKPILYIPSYDEMACFFGELDSWERGINRGLRLGKYRIMFRLYYCCGLRLSEARLLKRENVDLAKGTLTILQSKGLKDRLVYLPPDGVELLAGYLCDLERKMPGSLWVFPGDVPGKPINASAVQRTFKKCWNRLPLAANTDRQPSLHCLRHAFVVERMNEWMKQGVNLREMLSHLSKYLGHASPSETFYYYHLVNKAFTVVKQKDKVSARVIPEVMPYEEI